MKANGALIERIHIPSLDGTCEYCEVNMDVVGPYDKCIERVPYTEEDIQQIYNEFESEIMYLEDQLGDCEASNESLDFELAEQDERIHDLETKLLNLESEIAELQQHQQEE